MLTDVALKALKPREKIYKVADRDGMYVRVTPCGAISFLLDYRLNGRRETVHLGKYGHDGISLARAREKCLDARRAIREGRSPAIEKQRDKRRIKEAKSFGQFGEKWLTAAPMADSTRAMRRTIYERELLPVWRNRLLTEITPDDLRAHCGKIVDRSAPATAIHVRDIVKQIYGFAILHGEKVTNPADEVGPASIATFVPRDRSLSPSEIRVMLKQLEHIATLPTIRLGMKLYLLTMVRKSELQDAVWDEVDFENSVWTIPKERMKRSKAHNVYTSRRGTFRRWPLESAYPKGTRCAHFFRRPGKAYSRSRGGCRCRSCSWASRSECASNPSGLSRLTQVYSFKEANRCRLRWSMLITGWINPEGRILVTTHSCAS